MQTIKQPIPRKKDKLKFKRTQSTKPPNQPMHTGSQKFIPEQYKVEYKKEEKPRETKLNKEAESFIFNNNNSANLETSSFFLKSKQEEKVNHGLNDKSAEYNPGQQQSVDFTQNFFSPVKKPSLNKDAPSYQPNSFENPQNIFFEQSPQPVPQQQFFTQSFPMPLKQQFQYQNQQPQQFNQQQPRQMQSNLTQSTKPFFQNLIARSPKQLQQKQISKLKLSKQESGFKTKLTTQSEKFEIKDGGEASSSFFNQTKPKNLVEKQVEIPIVEEQQIKENEYIQEKTIDIGEQKVKTPQKEIKQTPIKVQEIKSKPKPIDFNKIIDIIPEKKIEKKKLAQKENILPSKSGKKIVKSPDQIRSILKMITKNRIEQKQQLSQNIKMLIKRFSEMKMKELQPQKVNYNNNKKYEQKGSYNKYNNNKNNNYNNKSSYNSKSNYNNKNAQNSQKKNYYEQKDEKPALRMQRNEIDPNLVIINLSE